MASEREPAVAAEGDPVDGLSYTEASRELDDIVAFFERRDVDVDQLVVRLARATAIVDELDRRLRRTRAQVEELVPRLQAAVADDEGVTEHDEAAPPSGGGERDGGAEPKALEGAADGSGEMAPGTTPPELF